MSSAYLEGIGRDEKFLLPECVEDYIPEDHPVRVIDAFVEGMSMGEENSALPPLRQMDAGGGRKGYHPATLAKLFIWGYINRVRSTRRLETEAGRNLELIWLLGKLRPDHSSISRFRKNHAKRIKGWLKEFNLICAGLGLFGGEELSVDGVFLKAVNSKRNNHTQERIDRKIQSLSARIDDYLAQLEASEKEAPRQPAGIENLKEKLGELEAARQEARQLLAQAQSSPTGQVSMVDADSRLLKKKSAPGAALVGLLGECAVDGKAHLIAAVEVHNGGNDFGQLSKMAAAAAEVLPEAQPSEGTQAQDADEQAKQEVEQSQPARRRLLADGGFFQINDLAECEEQGWDPYVPPYPQRKANAGKYPVSAFTYDEAGDSYRCPADQILPAHAGYEKGGSAYQTYYNCGACRQCPLKADCTGAKYRKIHRHKNEATVERMRRRLSAEPAIYRSRAATVEHPFGSMMFWNEGKNLLCRGLELANAEFSLSALAYNLKRAVKVVGIRELLQAMRERSISGCEKIAQIRPIRAMGTQWLRKPRLLNSQNSWQHRLVAIVYPSEAVA
jgi:transposase